MVTALSAFAAIFAATGGGPGSATEILNLYAYRLSFTELNVGYGSAMATVLLVITLSVAFLLSSHCGGRGESRRRAALSGFARCSSLFGCSRSPGDC